MSMEPNNPVVDTREQRDPRLKHSLLRGEEVRLLRERIAELERLCAPTTVKPASNHHMVTEAMVRRALHFCPADRSSPEKWRWMAEHINNDLAKAQQGVTVN